MIDITHTTTFTSRLGTITRQELFTRSDIMAMVKVNDASEARLYLYCQDAESASGDDKLITTALQRLGLPENSIDQYWNAGQSEWKYTHRATVRKRYLQKFNDTKLEEIIDCQHNSAFIRMELYTRSDLSPLVVLAVPSELTDLGIHNQSEDTECTDIRKILKHFFNLEIIEAVAQ